MKKITVAMIATTAMILAAPNAESGMMMQGKGMMGQGNKMMMQQGQGMGQNQSMMRGKCRAHGGKMMMKKKMAMKMNSPFLIKQGLPHMTKMVMMHMSDPAFALTPEQKEKLAAVKNKTMGTVREVKPQVMALRKEIVAASTSGTHAADLKEKVDKLASLEAQATMTHLECIDETTAILTKEQLLYLLANKNKGMKGMKRGNKQMRQGKGRMNKNK